MFNIQNDFHPIKFPISTILQWQVPNPFALLQSIENALTSHLDKLINGDIHTSQ